MPKITFLKRINFGRVDYKAVSPAAEQFLQHGRRSIGEAKIANLITAGFDVEIIEEASDSVPSK